MGLGGSAAVLFAIWCWQTATFIEARQAHNVTITLPHGSTDHGDPDLLCTPIKGYQILVFFATNYLAHVATYKTLPGQKASTVFLHSFIALLFPFSSSLQAVNILFRFAIREHPIFSGDAVRMAARAGALCFVVRSHPNAALGLVEPICGVTLQTHGPSGTKNSTTDADSEETFVLQDDFGAELPEASWRISSLGWNESMFADATIVRASRDIHGRQNLPIGYSMAVLPPSAIVNAATKSAHCTAETRRITLASSYNLPKAVIALVQTIYGSITLYRTRGNQISQYGYAAFGLTVLPYVVMSLVNLMASLATPDYPMMYLVKSAEMTEAIAKGGEFEGVVGEVENLEDYGKHSHTFRFEAQHGDLPIVARLFSSPTTSSSAAHSDLQTPAVPSDQESRPIERTEDALQDSLPLKTWNIPLNLRQNTKTTILTIPACTPFKTIQGSSSKTEDKNKLWIAKLFFALVIISIPFAVIGVLTHYSEGHSTLAQRVWTMTWLVMCVAAGVIMRIMTAADTDYDMKLLMVFLALLLCAPAIGGFVVVGQMLSSWGSCTGLGA